MDRFKRDHNLKLRKANNLKPGRGKMTTEQVEDYFANLSVELEGVPASNIFNFDETNFADDLKKKTVRKKN